MARKAARRKRRTILIRIMSDQKAYTGISSSVIRLVVHAVPALGNENGPLERHEFRSVGFLAECLDRHDALGWPLGGLPFIENFRLGVNGVSNENRGRELDVVPAQIADCLLADVADAHAGDNRESKATVYQRPTEFRLGRVSIVEMQGMLIHGQEREPGIVRFGDGPAGSMFVDCLLYTSDAADEEDSVDLGG